MPLQHIIAPLIHVRNGLFVVLVVAVVIGLIIYWLSGEQGDTQRERLSKVREAFDLIKLIGVLIIGFALYAWFTFN